MLSLASRVAMAFPESRSFFRWVMYRLALTDKANSAPVGTAQQFSGWEPVKRSVYFHRVESVDGCGGMHAFHYDLFRIKAPFEGLYGQPEVPITIPGPGGIILQRWCPFLSRIH